MKPTITLKHEFVEFIPEELSEHIVYVSIRFATASHLCCCGCKTKVVTPLRPTDWKLIFDGKTISLYPSVGNWSFACRSHYWIRNNWVEWSDDWSQEDVEAGRRRDQRAKDKYFGHPVRDNPPIPQPTAPTPLDEDEGLWWKLRQWWKP